jgi:histidine triad (HIT) family protein
MTGLSPDQKAALEQQKAQCPFCKIVKGEIPSKKTFEDEKIIAVLDINPLTDGHTLILPKEHYPIMPLIPADEFIHLFITAKNYTACMKKALARTGATIFIANGFAAGQMSAHFLFHIIPREEGDGIFNFNLEGINPVDQQEYDQVYGLVKNNLPIMMNNHFKRQPVDWHNTQGNDNISQKYTKDKVIAIIEQNPQLKEFILASPDQFIEQSKQHDQLKQLFSDVDVLEVIKHYIPEFSPKENLRTTESINSSESLTSSNTPDSSASLELSGSSDSLSDIASLASGQTNLLSKKINYTKEQIMDLIMKSNKLREIIITDPSEFLKMLETNEKLKEIFEGNNPEEIMKEVRAVFSDHENDSLVTKEVKEDVKEDVKEEVKEDVKEEVKEDVKEEVLDGHNKESETSLQHAIELVNNSPKVREMIETEPEEFKKKIETNHKLNAMFNGVNIDNLISHFHRLKNKDNNHSDNNLGDNLGDNISNDTDDETDDSSDDETDDVLDLLGGEK